MTAQAGLDARNKETDRNYDKPAEYEDYSPHNQDCGINHFTFSLNTALWPQLPVCVMGLNRQAVIAFIPDVPDTYSGTYR